MNWRIQSFTELQHLPPDERKRLVRLCVSRMDSARLIIRCVTLGGILGVLGSEFIVELLGIRGWVGPFVVIGGVLTGMALVYQLKLIRIRGQLLIHLEKISKRQRLPMCLSCGYDHQGLQSDACPECGMPIGLESPQSPTRTEPPIGTESE